MKLFALAALLCLAVADDPDPIQQVNLRSGHAPVRHPFSSRANVRASSSFGSERRASLFSDDDGQQFSFDDRHQGFDDDSSLSQPIRAHVDPHPAVFRDDDDDSSFEAHVPLNALDDPNARFILVSDDDAQEQFILVEDPHHVREFQPSQPAHFAPISAQRAQPRRFEQRPQEQRRPSFSADDDSHSVSFRGDDDDDSGRVFIRPAARLPGRRQPAPAGGFRQRLSSRRTPVVSRLRIPGPASSDDDDDTSGRVALRQPALRLPTAAVTQRRPSTPQVGSRRPSGRRGTFRTQGPRRSSPYGSAATRPTLFRQQTTRSGGRHTSRNVGRFTYPGGRDDTITRGYVAPRTTTKTAITHPGYGKSFSTFTI